MTSKMIIREFPLTGNKRWIDIQSPSAAELDQFAESHKIQLPNFNILDSH